MRWSVLFTLSLFLFHSPVRADVPADVCDVYLRVHTEDNRGFVGWPHLIKVLAGHYEATLILKVRDLPAVPELSKLSGLEKLIIRGGALLPDGRTRYLLISGWASRIYDARAVLAGALGPSLQFQTIALDARDNKIEVRRPGPLGRGAKHIRKRLGDWWWARALARTLLVFDHIYVALRDRSLDIHEGAYFRFLAEAEANPSLLQLIQPPKPPPTPPPSPRPMPPPPPPRPSAPKPEPKPAEPARPTFARGADRLNEEDVRALYQFIRDASGYHGDIGAPAVLRDLFGTLFDRVRGGRDPARTAWLRLLFSEFKFDHSVYLRSQRRPVLTAWRALFAEVHGRPRHGPLDRQRLDADMKAWPFPRRPKPVAPGPPPPVRVEEFDEIEITKHAGEDPDFLGRLRDVVARTYPHAPPYGTGRTVQMRLAKKRTLDMKVEADPLTPGGLLLSEVHVHARSSARFWSRVAAQAGFEDETFVLEGGTKSFGAIETDEIQVAAGDRARLEFEQGYSRDQLEQIFAALEPGRPWQSHLRAFAHVGDETYTVLFGSIDDREVRLRAIFPRTGGRGTH